MRARISPSTILGQLTAMNPRQMKRYLGRTDGKPVAKMGPKERAFLAANLGAIAVKMGAMFMGPNLRTNFGGGWGRDYARRAGEITVKGMEAVRESIKPGMTEIAVARVFDRQVKSQGAKGLAFTTLVLSGKHAALVFSKTGAHIQASERKIEAGDLVIVDAGAAVEFDRMAGNQLVGSDMTRTFAMGTVSPFQREIYELVRRAQEAAMSAVKAGAVTGELDAIARDIITEAGFGKCFSHTLGHGIRVADIGNLHSLPWLRSFSVATIKEGDVHTIEPGMCVGRGALGGDVQEIEVRPGVRFAGGVRIEDTVVVEKDGYTGFTEFPRDLDSMTIPQPSWT